MSKTRFDTEQVMLTLAFLSYRGFWGPQPHHQAEIADMIREGLAELEPLAGAWQLVWGPGTFRYLGSSLDDSLMYVVRRGTEERYAVVVRGTNPLSTPDWVFGDFLAVRQLPWKPAGREPAPGAKLTLSSALGLKILLELRAGGADPSPLGELAPKSWRELIRSGWDHPLKKSKIDKKVQDLLITSVDRIYDGAAKLDDGLEDCGLGELVESRNRLLENLDSVLAPLADGALELLQPILWRETERAAESQRGATVVEFLRDTVARADGELRIDFTGHSKGGALAPVLAQHLADTQGPELSAEHRWDPNRQATLHCYAFAGPTSGNEAFARHLDKTIGANTHRIVNRLDLVGWAWLPDGIRGIPQLYAPFIDASKLQPLADAVARDVERMANCHIGQHVTVFPGVVDTRYENFFSQERHQHTQAYLDALDLADVLHLSDFSGR